MTKTATIEQIIADNAKPIATALGLNLDADDQTPAGFPDLLERAANRVCGHLADWLTEAAYNLHAYNLLGDDAEKSQALLNEVHATLYDTRADLASM